MSVPTSALSAVGGSASFIGSLVPPLGDLWSQFLYNKMPVKHPDLGTILHLRMRDIITDEDFKTYFRKAGIEDGRANLILAGAKQLISAGDCLEAWRRGLIDEKRLTDELRSQGISTPNIPLLKELGQFWPSAGDLVTFGRRDIFDPAVVKFFGYKDNLPAIPKQYLKGAGLTEEMWEFFWMAHWRDIEFGMATEMLHRQEIDDKEYDLMLRAANYPPAIVDKLKAIAYQPLTRVDVRRMYRLGVMDESGLLKAYRDLGYSLENAQLMVEFTKKYESGEDKGITRSAVQAAYKKGIIETEEFRAYLRGLDFPEPVVDFWVEMTDYEIAEKEIDDAIDDVKQRYQIGELSLEGVKIELDKIGLPAEFAIKVSKDLASKVSLKLKLPSVSDLTKWLKDGLIDDVTFGHRMLELGYQQGDVVNYIQEAQLVKDTSKRSYLAKTHYQKLLKAKVIDTFYFTATLTETGVSQEDINYMIMEVLGVDQPEPEGET